MDKPLTWISAPAGSGKTTLIASYLDSRKLPCIWYQVDEGDADIASFFYYMGLAAKKAAPRYRKPLPLLTPEYALGIPTFTRRYFESLCSRLKTPFAIILENYQEAPEQSGFHDLIISGIDALPQGITMIVLSRGNPPAQYARLRANDRVELLDRDEIKFTLDEAKEIINLRSREKISETILKQFYEKSDGWVAGILLFTERLNNGETDLHFLKGKRPPEEIFEYFAGEICGGMDETIQDFLMKTSFLPGMTSHMAVAVSENRDAGQILSDLSRRNCFTEKRSLEEDSYQYHPLFREYLQARAKRLLTRQEVLKLQTKAADILENLGQIADAARLFMEAGDWEGLSRLILSHAPQTASEGKSMTLMEWLNNIPPDMLEQSPWLLYWKGICRFLVNPAEAQLLFEKAFNLFVDGGQDTAGIFLSWAGVVKSILYGFENMAQADEWAPLLDNLIREYGGFPSAPVEAGVSSAMFNLIVMRKIKRADFDLWLHRALSSPDLAVKADTLFHLGFYHTFMGNVEQAMIAVDSLRQIAASGNAPPFVRIKARLMEIMFLTLAGDHKRRIDLAIEGLRIADESGVHILDLMLAGHGMLAALGSNDPSLARTFSIRLPSDMEKLRLWDQSFCRYVAAFESFLSGDHRKAAAYCESAMELLIRVGHQESAAACLLLHAHVLHKLDEYRKAAQCLEEFFRMNREVGSDIAKFSYCLTRALFAMEQGDKKTSLQYLKQGMETGKKRGYAGNYMGLALANARLCALAFENGIEAEYVQSLIRKLRLVPGESMPHNELWPYPLKIYALGKFDIFKDDKPVQFSGKVPQKPLELLKALIAFGGKNVPVNKLTDALWPEAAGDAAYSSFKVNLHHLRKLLGKEEAVLTSGGRISLNFQYCYADAPAFQHLVDRIMELRTGAGKAEMKEIIPLAEKAIGMYKGNFIEDEDGYPYIAALRERLRSRFSRLVEITGMYYETRKQWHKAVGLYEKGLETDELQEEFYKCLMLCYKKLGRYSDAASVYNRCRRMLHIHFGVEPSAATRAAFEQLSAP